MTENVEPGGCGDCLRRGAGVVGIEKAERWLQQSSRYAGLHVQPREIEDGHARGLAASASGRWNGEERLERTGDRKSLTDRLVHVVQKVGRGVSRVEVHRLRGIDRRAAANANDGVECMPSRDVDRLEPG